MRCNMLMANLVDALKFFVASVFSVSLCLCGEELGFKHG